MQPSQQLDVAKAEPLSANQTQIVLALLDCISRSSACLSKQAEEAVSGELRYQLARLEATLHNDSTSGAFRTDASPIPDEVVLADLAAEESTAANATTEMSLSLTQLLVRLSFYRKINTIWR